MRIVGAASAFPKYHYDQKTLCDAFVAYWGDRLPERRKFELLHSNVGVNGRYLSLPVEEYPGLRFSEANDVWIQTAIELGEKAIPAAVAQAGIDKSEISAFFFVSVTGIASPSIDARLINKLELSTGMRRVPVFGLGCVAGAAGISLAADYVRAYPKKYALLLSVELCTLTIQHEDLSMANLISTGLFGDGGAAVIVAGSETAAAKNNTAGPEIIATQPTFYPNTESVMGWDISANGFQIVLSPEVPNVIAGNVGRDLDKLLSENRVTRADIGCWMLHTGGPKILRATAQALGIGDEALWASWEALGEMGNLSSSSVLMVLEKTMAKRPEPGTWSILAAMGPAFCSELVLLRW
jgi:alkylresorcinol/alkylpyrone synthase